jgi:hypothetical protein
MSLKLQFRGVDPYRLLYTIATDVSATNNVLQLNIYHKYGRGDKIFAQTPELLQ